MTPIAKNILVVDESGNTYTSTYAKRAQGLVKKGRARWLDDDTICLACPPDNMYLEDTEMDKNIDNRIVEIEQAQEAANVQNFPEEKGAGGPAITARELLDRIDRIVAQGDELRQVVERIHDLPVNSSKDGGIDGGYRAQAIGEIYAGREATNQKAIDLLQRMYEESTAGRERTLPEKRKEIFDHISEISSGGNPDSVRILLDFYQRQLDNL